MSGPADTKVGLLYMTPPTMDAGDAAALLDIARYMDETDFDALFFVDHFFLEGDRYLATPRDVGKPHQIEAYTSMAAVIGATRRLRTGTMVTPLPLRHPSFVAKMAGTIDLISNGRLNLGVGTGWNPREYSAYSFDFEQSYLARLEMLTEGVEIIRKLWSYDGDVVHDGKHYTLEAAPFYPKPVQKPPPIWFGGSGKKTLDAVARHADVWSPAAPHYNAVSPEVYAEGLRTVRKKALEYGRDPDSILPAVLLNTSVATTRELAWERAKAQQLRSDWKDIPLEAMQESGVLAVGTPDDVVAHLQRYIDAGARYITVCPVPMTTEVVAETARLYAEYVIPALPQQP